MLLGAGAYSENPKDINTRFVERVLPGVSITMQTVQASTNEP